MIKTIIFDFAGVLTIEGFRKGLIRKLKEKYHFEEELFNTRFLEHEGLYMAGKITAKDFWTEVCDGFNIPFDYFTTSFQNCYELNQQVVEIIESCKKRVKTVLFSDNFDVLSGAIKKDRRISGLFQEMYFSDEMGLIKRNGESYIVLFQSLNENPNNCVMIDDKEQNLLPAKKLGCDTILFTDAENLKKSLAKVLI